MARIGTMFTFVISTRTAFAVLFLSSLTVRLKDRMPSSVTNPMISRPCSVPSGPQVC
jgi:hypothetical protein